MQRRLMLDDREKRAFIYLITACVLIFVAQVPRLWQLATQDPSVPFDTRIGGAMFGWVFLAPLGFYAVAALSHIVARLLGGRGDWQSARLALFWSLLAVAPLWMINGMVAGLAPASLLLGITGAIALLCFVVVWGASLYEAEKGHHAS